MMQQPGRQPPRKRFASQQKRKPPVKIAPLDTSGMGGGAGPVQPVQLVSARGQPRLSARASKDGFNKKPTLPSLGRSDADGESARVRDELRETVRRMKSPKSPKRGSPLPSATSHKSHKQALHSLGPHDDPLPPTTQNHGQSHRHSHRHSPQRGSDGYAGRHSTEPPLESETSFVAVGESEGEGGYGSERERSRPQSGRDGNLGESGGNHAMMDASDRMQTLLDLAEQVDHVKNSERERQRRAHHAAMVVKQKERKLKQTNRVARHFDGTAELETKIDSELERQRQSLQAKIKARQARRSSQSGTSPGPPAPANDADVADAPAGPTTPAAEATAQVAS
eukprot:m.122577 g.122577  ORF g.122577 m.122577 type:complete len:338 (-) comp13422_c0_seq4:111-1124(-)